MTDKPVVALVPFDGDPEDAAAFYAGQLATTQQMLVAAQDSLELARLEVERLTGEREFTESRRAAPRPTGYEQEGRVELTVARGVPGWTIADLEEVAYRLRCAGGVDGTSVAVGATSAVATVPAPYSMPLTVGSTRYVPPPAVPADGEVSIPRVLVALLACVVVGMLIALGVSAVF